jgi:hypothetical protein
MQVANNAIYLGRLMSPQEVKEATMTRNEIPCIVQNSWFLCGDVTDEFWCALLENPRKNHGFRVSAFTTPSDGAYVMLTVQLKNMQCRFLLSLSDAKVIKFIDDAGKTGIWLSLGRNDGHESILQAFPVNPEHLQPISALAHGCKNLAPADALVEFQLAALAAQDRKTIPSVVPGFAVRHVSLSLIAPF